MPCRNKATNNKKNKSKERREEIKERQKVDKG